LSVVILLALVYLAQKFGLDVILGAFASGLVVGLASRSEKAEPLHQKLEGIGFGFFVPIFFITSGMKFNLDALLNGGTALLRVPVFLALFLVIRGLPLVLYRNDLGRRDRWATAFYSATALPLVVAVTTIAVSTGHMRSENAAALVGAAMISVFVFPLLALTLRRRGAERPEARPVAAASAAPRPSP
jgi:Kef-type K+ transport system membrane component KefB